MRLTEVPPKTLKGCLSIYVLELPHGGFASNGTTPTHFCCIMVYFKYVCLCFAIYKVKLAMYFLHQISLAYIKPL